MNAVFFLPSAKSIFFFFSSKASFFQPRPLFFQPQLLFLGTARRGSLCSTYSFVYLYSALHVGMCTNLEGWLSRSKTQEWDTR